MSDAPERRHPHVVNVDEVQPMGREIGTRFASTMRLLGMSTGSEAVGCNHFEIPPGKTAFPAHYHCAIEEALYVLGGTGSLRLGDQDGIPLRAGDYVTFLAGPDHAHQVTNTGDEPLTYLCLSNRAVADVVGYPDSGKILALATPHTDFRKPAWVRELHKQDAAVGYWDGEEAGG